ncbi:MAG: VWA domain-containing protein [Bryobacterales bacterium]|nr:VWA domain-containing protein [Bryobacterales bacterium]
MHRRKAISLLAASAASPWLRRTAGAQEEAIISVDVEVVNVLATVRDNKGGLVTDLNKDDFILEEDGKRQQIRYFSQQTDLPLTVGLLVDTSVSQERLIYEEQRAAAQFFSQVLRLQKDLAFLISFDVNVELLQDLTGSQRLLERSLEDLQVEGANRGIHPGPVPNSGRPVGTALYDAVYLASDEMMQGQVGRKAIVLISDGVDYGSRVDREEAVEAAHKSDVVVYGVRYYDRTFYYGRMGFAGGGSGALKKMARETGGNVFEVTRKRTLRQIFDEIQNELRSQYSIGFSPESSSSGAGLRKINLRTRRKNLKVQARTGYYPKST